MKKQIEELQKQWFYFYSLDRELSVSEQQVFDNIAEEIEELKEEIHAEEKRLNGEWWSAEMAMRRDLDRDRI